MKVRKIFALLLAAILVLVAAGCGGTEPNQADTDAVAAAVDKFRACKSFTAVQLTEIDELVKLEGEEIFCKVLNEMEISLVAEPDFAMQTITIAKMEYDGEQMEQFSASYLVPENGGYAEYFSDGTEWYKLSTQEDVAQLGIGASAVVDTFFTDQIAFCKVGEETLDGINAARYDGQLSTEDLIALLEANGQLSGIESMSENQQNKIRENLLKDLEPLTVSVWLDEVQGYPLRFEVKMAGALNAMQSSIAKSLGNKTSDAESKLEKYTISMVLSNFDAVREIILPPESASATLYETE